MLRAEADEVFLGPLGRVPAVGRFEVKGGVFSWDRACCCV